MIVFVWVSGVGLFGFCVCVRLKLVMIVCSFVVLCVSMMLVFLKLW